MTVEEEIRSLVLRKELLQKINNFGKKEKLSGYKIAGLIDSYLQEDKVNSLEFYIKLQGTALYEGDNKPIFPEVKKAILRLEQRIKKLEKVSEFTFESPKKNPELEAKLDLMLKINDLTIQKESGYKIIALIDSYSELVDINSFHVLEKIREYAFKRGDRPLSLIQMQIERKSLTYILKKTIISINGEIYWNKKPQKDNNHPEKKQIAQDDIQTSDLKKIYKEVAEINIATKTIKDIQSVFLVFFIIEFLISFVIGFLIGAGI